MRPLLAYFGQSMQPWCRPAVNHARLVSRSVLLRLPAAVNGTSILWVQVLAPDTLLALCFLACWLLRQPVMPADLLRWALDGRLPYLLLGDACADLLAAAGPHRPPIAALLPPGAPWPCASSVCVLCWPGTA